MTDTGILKIKGGEVVEGDISYTIHCVVCNMYHCIVTYHTETEIVEIKVINETHPDRTEYEVTMENSWSNFADHNVIKNVTTLFDIFKNNFEKDDDSIGISCKDKDNNDPSDHNDGKLQITVCIDLKYIFDEIKFDVPMKTIVKKQCEKCDTMIEELRQVKLQFEESQKKCEKMTPSIEAVNYLGSMYETGKGVEQNYEKAIKYYKMAIEGCNGSAMYNLGNMYYNGKGLEQNYEESIKYYKMATEKGEEHAMYNLGYMYEFGKGVEQNDGEAIKYYKMAIEEGHSSAMCSLGYMYDNGKGVEQNYEEAIKYYKMAIEKGNGKAMYNLGSMYCNGAGVEQDYEKAIKYYKMAIEKGEEKAMNNLGRMYDFGKGVEQNCEEAIKYYKMAIEKDCKKALENIELMIPKLNEVDNQTKFRCYKLLMQNEKTQEYAKKITVKCDIEEISNLYDTIEELRKKLDN